MIAPSNKVYPAQKTKQALNRWVESLLSILWVNCAKDEFIYDYHTLLEYADSFVSF